MTADHQTSMEAYRGVNESGAAGHIRALVYKTFLNNGPMADFEMQDMLPKNDLRSLMARRLELTTADHGSVVGLMDFKVINPKTNRDALVWGLVKEHSAKPYHPVDFISVRIRGEHATAKFTDTDLHTLTAMQLGHYVFRLIHDDLGDGQCSGPLSELPF
jgi:hypothetical protein